MTAGQTVMRTVILLCFTVLTAPNVNAAGICDGIGGCKPAGCTEPVMLVCQPTVTAEPAKKSCWDVECEYVCIPPVRFPWQPCGTPGGCGKIRCVKKLKKVSYECGTDYTWEWDVRAVCPPGICKPGYGADCDVLPCSPCR